MDNTQFFFCYSKKLADYLKARMPAITTAIHPASGKRFTLFFRSTELKQAMDEYDALLISGSNFNIE